MWPALSNTRGCVLCFQPLLVVTVVSLRCGAPYPFTSPRTDLVGRWSFFPKRKQMFSVSISSGSVLGLSCLWEAHAFLANWEPGLIESQSRCTWPLANLGLGWTWLLILPAVPGLLQYKLVTKALLAFRWQGSATLGPAGTRLYNMGPWESPWSKVICREWVVTAFVGYVTRDDRSQLMAITPILGYNQTLFYG